MAAYILSCLTETVAGEMPVYIVHGESAVYLEEDNLVPFHHGTTHTPTFSLCIAEGSTSSTCGYARKQGEDADTSGELLDSDIL